MKKENKCKAKITYTCSVGFGDETCKYYEPLGKFTNVCMYWNMHLCLNDEAAEELKNENR